MSVVICYVFLARRLTSDQRGTGTNQRKPARLRELPTRVNIANAFFSHGIRLHEALAKRQ
jgi:hypothetical protein